MINVIYYRRVCKNIVCVSMTGAVTSVGLSLRLQTNLPLMAQGEEYQNRILKCLLLMTYLERIMCLD